MSKVLNLKAIEHFIVVVIVAFASQVAIAGAPLDLSSAAGRSAAATGVLLVLWRVLRENASGTNAGTPDTTGTTTGS